jgi:hypothetical protein
MSKQSKDHSQAQNEDYFKEKFGKTKMFGHSDLQWFPWITMGQLCLLTNSLLRHWVKGMCSMMDMLTVLHFGIKDLEFSNLNNKSWVSFFYFHHLFNKSTNQLSIKFPLSTTSCKLTYHRLGFLTRGRYTNSDEVGTQIWHMWLSTFGYIALAQAATSSSGHSPTQKHFRQRWGSLQGSACADEMQAPFGVWGKPKAGGTGPGPIELFLHGFGP